MLVDVFTEEGKIVGKQRANRKDLGYERLAYMANIMLVSIHFCLLLIFAVLRIYPMLVLNLISIVVYAINFYWANNNLRVFFYVAYMEILIHMVISNFILGWNFGFQLYGFALILCSYYGDYISRKIWNKTIHPRINSLCVIGIYLFLYIASFFIEPICNVTSTAASIMIFTVNAISVFVFMIVYIENYRAIVERTENSLIEAAEKDELTQMHNRRNMQERLDYIFTQNAGKSEIAIAIIDIDDFKRVNDTYGHNAGDLVLFEVAARIMEKEAPRICACRWGGEEFLILSTGEGAYQKLVGIINELVQRVRNDDHVYENQIIHVTISAGISVWEKGEKIEHTISRADQYLYEAKKAGKNRYITRDRIW